MLSITEHALRYVPRFNDFAMANAWTCSHLSAESSTHPHSERKHDRHNSLKLLELETISACSYIFNLFFRFTFEHLPALLLEAVQSMTAAERSKGKSKEAWLNSGKSGVAAYDYIADLGSSGGCLPSLQSCPA